MFLNPRTTGRRSFDSVLVRLACLGRAQVHKTEAPEDCVPIELCALTVYKFDHSAVDGNPEARFKCLKKMVGERGFEPPTPGPELGGKEAILLLFNHLSGASTVLVLLNDASLGLM